MSRTCTDKNTITLFFTPLLLILVVYPLVALHAHLRVEGVTRVLEDPVFWDSTAATVVCAIAAASLSLLLAIGFGYCYLFAQRGFVYRMANLMNDIPIALPHTVAGLALLLAFGRNALGFVGETGLAFSLIAVVLAMFFVSYPLAARAIASGVDKMDREIVEVARTLGDTPTKAYLRVVVPTLGEAIFSAFVLAVSRSLSEFAAVIMFGGNVPGVTQVLASYVFTKVEEGELEMAVAASAFCTILSLLTVLTLRRVRHAQG